MSPLVLHLSQIARNAHHCASQARHVEVGGNLIVYSSTALWQETLSNAHSFWNIWHTIVVTTRLGAPRYCHRNIESYLLGSVLEFESGNAVIESLSIYFRRFIFVSTLLRWLS